MGFFLPSLAYLHAIQIMNHYAFLTEFFFQICLLPAVFFQLSLKHILIRTEKELTQLPQINFTMPLQYLKNAVFWVSHTLV